MSSAHPLPSSSIGMISCESARVELDWILSAIEDVDTMHFLKYPISGDTIILEYGLGHEIRISAIESSKFPTRGRPPDKHVLQNTKHIHWNAV